MWCAGLAANSPKEVSRNRITWAGTIQYWPPTVWQRTKEREIYYLNTEPSYNKGSEFTDLRSHLNIMTCRSIRSQPERERYCWWMAWLVVVQQTMSVKMWTKGESAQGSKINKWRHRYNINIVYVELNRLESESRSVNSAMRTLEDYCTNSSSPST